MKSTIPQCTAHNCDMVVHDEGEHIAIYKCPRCTNAYVKDKGCSMFCSCGKGD